MHRKWTDVRADICNYKVALLLKTQSEILKIVVKTLSLLHTHTDTAVLTHTKKEIT